MPNPKKRGRPEQPPPYNSVLSADNEVERITREQYFAVTSRMDNTQSVIGHAMEAIEALGLPDRQEEAHKGQIKKIVYQFYSEACRCASYLMDEKIRKEVFPN